MTYQELYLFIAIDLFVKRFRILIVSLLDPENTGNWETKFREVIYSNNDNRKQKHWDDNIRSKSEDELIECIDILTFEIFANKSKDLFEPIFGEKDKFHLPTWLSDIAKVRNKLAHNNKVKQKEIDRAWLNILEIAEIINDKEILNELNKIKQAGSNKNKSFEFEDLKDSDETISVLIKKLEITDDFAEKIKSSIKENIKEIEINKYKNIITITIIIVLVVCILLLIWFHKNNSNTTINSTNNDKVGSLKTNKADTVSSFKINSEINVKGNVGTVITNGSNIIINNNGDNQESKLPQKK